MKEGFLDFMKNRKSQNTEYSMEDLMKLGVTRILNGREITLGYTDKNKRIGWVWKDTGLPASMEESNG
jgi:hypothetical protein